MIGFDSWKFFLARHCLNVTDYIVKLSLGTNHELECRFALLKGTSNNGDFVLKWAA